MGDRTYRRPRTLLINDTSEVCHWGCTATSTALKNGVLRRGLELETVPASSIPRLGRLLQVAEDFDRPDVAALLREKAPVLTQAIHSADSVLVNGEGSLHGDRNVAKTLLYILWYSAKVAGKPVDLVNHSCYPQDRMHASEDALLEFYRRAYAVLRYVAVREPVSWRLVTDSLRRDAVESFDCLPLYLDSLASSSEVERTPTVCVASSVIWNKRWAPRLVRTLARLADKGWKLRLLVGANGDWNHEDIAFVTDLRCAWRWHSLGRGRPLKPAPWEVRDARTLGDWLEAIASSRLLISGRFHHSIAAYCLGTPRVMLDSNTPKVQGMLEVIGGSMAASFGAKGWGEDLDRAIAATLDQALPSEQDVAKRRKQLCNLAERNFAGLDSGPR